MEKLTEHSTGKGADGGGRCTVAVVILYAGAQSAGL